MPDIQRTIATMTTAAMLEILVAAIVVVATVAAGVIETLLPAICRC